MTTDSGVAKPVTAKEVEKAAEHRGPLPPLGGKTATQVEQEAPFSTENLAGQVVTMLRLDIDCFAVVVEKLLATQDSKKICQLVKAGFERRIAALQQEYAELQTALAQKVEGGQMSQAEMLIRLKNLDGKIRSLQWFHSNLS